VRVTAPRGDHESLVPDLERPADRLGDDRARASVAADDAPEQQLRVRAHLPERDDDVPRLERSLGGLRQERRVEHEVVGVDDRRASFAEQACDVRSGEPTADHERSSDSFASFVHRARDRTAVARARRSVSSYG
jgi:hypothetical protein